MLNFLQKFGQGKNIEFSIRTDASRSRQSRSNEYFIVNIGFETAANKPSNVWSRNSGHQVMNRVHRVMIRIRRSVGRHQRGLLGACPRNYDGGRTPGRRLRSGDLASDFKCIFLVKCKGNFEVPNSHFAELFRARSRLYPSQNLQVNTRWN